MIFSKYKENNEVLFLFGISKNDLNNFLNKLPKNKSKLGLLKVCKINNTLIFPSKINWEEHWCIINGNKIKYS